MPNGFLGNEVMMKNKDIVIWLRKKQDKLQKEFKKKITKQRKSIYDFRGIWIQPACACGNEFRTPYHIRDTGLCPKCNKLFCRAMKTNEYVDKEFHTQKSTTTSKKSGHNSR